MHHLRDTVSAQPESGLLQGTEDESAVAAALTVKRGSEAWRQDDSQDESGWREKPLQ